MKAFTLVIGNKNYSSWSLRPWLLMKHFEIPFEEIRIPLYRADSTAALKKYSPSGLVPALIHGDFAVWDSIAIAEYLNELFPNASMWPKDQHARARARSISAEMHAGFGALRTQMSMNCRKSFPGKGYNEETKPQIERVCQIWNESRSQYGKEGPFLFGRFSIADAMYAPVVLRFNTYQVKTDAVSRAYIANVLELPELKEWINAACAEVETIPEFEIYERTTTTGE